jgi:carbohydrate kinase (thermoresistant glucokinase family)
MGPTGNGKSTLGRALAWHLGVHFIEGDDCHPPANIAKMARGDALDDADRQPFLHNVARAMLACPHGSVAACSALTRPYRALLRAELGQVLFVLPQVPAQDLQRRLENRPGHFMPPSLIASQLATLELPQADEWALLIDGTQPTDILIADIAPHLASKSQPSAPERLDHD